MKGKRILAIVISLAMVLSVVPSFSLTASAAGTTGVIDALGGEVLWACPDGSFNDTAIGTAFSGWSSSITSGYVNVKTYSGVGNVIQYYVNGTANVTTITSPGYGDGTEEKLIIEWKMKRQKPNDLYFDFSFTDKSGTEIAFLKLDKNYTSVSGEYYMGYPADATDCAIVATNNGDGTHNVEYYVAGSVVSTVTNKSGTVNGFGGITSSNGRWSTVWNHIGFGDLTIGAVYPASATQVEVSVGYTADGQVVKTINGRYDTTNQSGLALDAFTYAPNGGNYIYTAESTTMAESGTIAMTRQENWAGKAIGEQVTSGGIKYQIASGNLIPNGNFAQGTTGWYAGNGAVATFFTSNGDGTMTTTSGGGAGATAGALYRAWKVEPGKTYAYTYYSSGGGSYHITSLKDSVGATAADGTKLIQGTAGSDNLVVFTPAEGQNYIQISCRWLGTSDTFGNFGLYELEEVIETTADTVKAGMDAISLPLATKTSIELPETSADPYGYESTITWTSSHPEVMSATGAVTAPSDITVVTMTPSTTYNGSTVEGKAHTIYVFPSSVAGTEYNSGAGYYDIGTTNLISLQGTNASFEGDGAIDLTGWYAHTGQQTNAAILPADAATSVVPDGNWAFASKWSDGITGTNYCTIDTMWEVEAGTYYLSFYSKERIAAINGQVYVYFSEDNAHHTSVSSITGEAWVEKVNPTTDWVKYEFIIEAPTAGYIGITGFNLSDGANESQG
ncbi:MAG: hypothetical protein IKU60_06405, partial [Clostridia bacterium]|nr:hypothetical protein [Clostridia bacterium]